MGLIIIFILLTALYTFLFSLIPLSPWFIILWVFVSAILAIISLVLSALLVLLLCNKKKPKGAVRHFYLRNACYLAIKFNNIKLKISGKENIPNNEAFVIYANHKSIMDPICIYYALNSRITAIGKKSLFKTKIMKLVLKTFDAIALDRDNDREAAKSMIEAIKKVKNGLPILIFPEGGIKNRESEEMSDLKAGAYKLALKSNASILPVSIIGTSSIKGSSIFKKKQVKVIIHAPISKEDYKDKNTHEIGRYVEEIINDGVKNG